MFHVAAWGEQINPGGVFTAINVGHEPALFVDGVSIKVPREMAYTIGEVALINDASAVRARLQTPTLDIDGGHDIEPVITAATFSSPPSIQWHPDSPLELEPGEFMRIYMESNPAAPVRHLALIWLADGFVVPLKDEIYSVRATGDVDQDNFRWKNGNITFLEPLPAGRYVVVGMRCRSNSGIAARLVFRNQLGRPGCPIVTTVDALDGEEFRFGNLGVWGSFLQEDPPTLDVFHGTALSQELILDLVRF